VAAEGYSRGKQPWMCQKLAAYHRHLLYYTGQGSYSRTHPERLTRMGDRVLWRLMTKELKGWWEAM